MSPLLLATLLPAWLFQAQAAPADPSALTAAALEANPELEVLEHRIEALRALAGVAGVWMDPMVGVEYSNVPVSTFWLSDHGMAGLQLRVQQTLPAPGVPGLRREVAEARVAVAEASLDEARVALGGEVEAAWWRLTLVRQLRSVTERHVALTGDLVSAVRSRYEVGEAGQSELLRLEVLRDKLTDDLSDFSRSERELTAALQAALAWPESADLETPAEAQPVDVVSDARAWLERARAQRPALAGLDREAEVAERSARLARADARPDVTLWAGYRVRTFTSEVDPGTDLASLGVSVPIPLAATRRAHGQEASALEDAARLHAAREAKEDALLAQLERIEAGWSRAREKARTYSEVLLPDAESALQTTLSDYRVGKTGFSSLYQAEVQLLDLERARLAAVVETHLQESAARAAIGGPLVETPSAGAH